MPAPDGLKALTSLGFTNLEAEIYAFLLQESPATGYRIAQAIGKPAANTYKAIQTLERKGAVVVEDGTSRQCRAIPSDELLSRLTREFQSVRDRAALALKDLGQPKGDERVYQIRAYEGVVQRARQMLIESKRVALASVPSAMIDELKPELEVAAARGVDVCLKFEREVSIAGTETVVVPPIPGSPGSELKIVVDGEQHLVAMISGKQTLIHAVWSSSPFLSIAHHRGLAAEINLAQVASRVRDEAGTKRLLRALTLHRPVENTAGFRMLAGEDLTSELAAN